MVQWAKRFSETKVPVVLISHNQNRCAGKMVVLMMSRLELWGS
ncbi:autoinducer-binding protein [Lactiplantibacillus argentoratensis]|uniref:Autoinducer-binding protein n=1 Tax=Lactiplantibacillus argentoratensis TaxID=271881 RepID=A0AAN1Q306_9LACO|nr:autoinducer-binding protein [Lactiplantibacillus plantarum]AYJ36650.1 autoinducer-binding protein [Lactiplantibacillus argentoratensis]KON39090.1 autoinducer-binding protein [Lactiplantibacillus plantarum]MCT4442733.1 autoinducer-binding protein [Lactiplantibacillus argentoratensis]MPQ37369.1 autoinducer-binding protein [Lactiplantibacillus plantarum]